MQNAFEKHQQFDKQRSITFNKELRAGRNSFLIDLHLSISSSVASRLPCNADEITGSKRGFTMLIHSSWLCLNSCLYVQNSSESIPCAGFAKIKIREEKEQELS